MPAGCSRPVRQSCCRAPAPLRSMRRSSRSCRRRSARVTPKLSSPAHGRGRGDIAIEATGLTQTVRDFVAVDHVSFRISRGEIFGFLGSNGCGKTTTMKMLTGLLPPTEGTSTLFGEKMDANDIELRRRVGFMSQAFSLYTELTVQQNLDLHARLSACRRETPHRVAEVAERFELTQVRDALPDGLPMGIRQRLSLAVAMIHSPEMLILDEPTSGVDQGRTRRFLANPHRAFQEGQRDDLHLDPLHERGRALRPHFAHERGQGVGQRHAEEHRSDAASGKFGRRIYRLPRRRHRPKSLGRERRLNQPRPQPLRRRNGALAYRRIFQPAANGRLHGAGGARAPPRLFAPEPRLVRQRHPVVCDGDGGAEEEEEERRSCSMPSRGQTLLSSE